MPSCIICKTDYPLGTVLCPKDGAPIKETLSGDLPEDDPALSTLEEGLTADALKEQLSSPPTDDLSRTISPVEGQAAAPLAPLAPGVGESGKLRLGKINAGSVAQEPSLSAGDLTANKKRLKTGPAAVVKPKTGPVPVVAPGDEEQSGLAQEETLFAQGKAPPLQPPPPPEAKESEEEDGGVSTLDEQVEAFDRYIGMAVNNHRIEKKLGQGGMGSVYLASHFTLGRQVAVKILNQQFVAKHEVVRRFFDEARAANKIHHPNIIEVFDVGVLPDRAAYLVMELLNGRDLKALLKERQALSPEEVQRLFIPICDALQAAHDVGIIHRDLKPENIFICQQNGQDFPKIVDFGIAKLSDNNMVMQNRTRTGMVMGTPAYMSPEQAAGQKQLDARADIYSLGVILYECLTGHPPFVGESVAAILIKQVTEIPQEARDFAPDKHIPPKLNALVQRCLEKDPNDRPQSMREILAVLQDAETFVSSGVVEAVAKPAAPAGAEAKQPAAVTAPPGERPKEVTKVTRVREIPRPGDDQTLSLEPAKRSLWLWGVGGVAFAAVLFFSVWSVLKPAAPLPKPPSASQEIDIPTLQFAPPAPKGFMRSGQEIPWAGK